MDFYPQRTLDAIERETSGMSVAQLSWHPHAKWSTAQILEHLSLAFSSTSKLMDRCLKQGHAEVRRATAREWVSTLVVVRLGYFPGGRQAPEWTRPRGLDASKSVQDVCAALKEMDQEITVAEEKFGSGVIAVHPIIGPLTARHWRKFHWEHTRHHMKQVRALREAAPKARAGSAA